MKKEVLHKQYPRLYSIYSGMLDRCLNEKNSNFHNYGGRGIVVCIEWIRSRELFIEWALDNGYQEHLTIDRIDVNGTTILLIADGQHTTSKRKIKGQLNT